MTSIVMPTFASDLACGAIVPTTRVGTHAGARSALSPSSVSPARIWPSRAVSDRFDPASADASRRPLSREENR
jgi:hypothetical protein